MRKILRFLAPPLLLICFLPGLIEAQEGNISGTVLSDDDGTPMIGVTVTNTVTNTRTQTNSVGYYSLAAQKGHNLSFTFVGYAAQFITVGDNRLVNLRLVPSDKEIGNVVVTGYGQRRNKRELAYQTPIVKGEEIAQTKRTNFLEALAGRVPGLTVTSTSGMPGASAQIMLRGGVSIGGNNQPLFVVDGVPMDNGSVNQEDLVSGSSALSLANRNSDYSNRIADINPEDIENVTILKGPEATSVYGSDGAAGAIVITTKKGTTGRTRITYTNTFTVSEVYRFPKIQTVYARGNNGISDPAAYSTIYSYRFFGSKYPEGTQLYDNIRNFFVKAFSQQHSLTMEAGTTDFNYRFSAGYVKQSGVVPNTSLTRLNFRFSSNAKLNKVLTLNSSFAYTFSENDKAIKGAGSFYTNLITFPSDIDGRDYINTNGTRKVFRNVDPSVEFDSPFWEVNKNRAEDKSDNLSGNITLNAAITKGLTFTGIVGLNQYSTEGVLYYNPQSKAAYTLGGYLSTFEQIFRGLSTTARINYRKTIAKKFSNDFYAGTYMESNTSSLNAQRGERFFEPDFISINNTAPTSRDAKLTRYQIRKVRGYVGYTFGFNNLLYVTLTGTREGVSTLSSKFYEKTPFFNYGSASASFIFSDLAFMKKIEKIVSYAKFRGSYASTGKGPIRPYIIDYQFQSVASTGGGFALGVTGNNPDLTPEFSNNFEVGGEFKFLKNKIGIDIAYFDNKVKNQIIANRLSYGTGFILKYVNGGSLAAKGWEIQLTATPVNQKNFTWNTTVNFDKARTIIEAMPGNLPFYYDSDTWVFGNVISFARKGVSLGNLSGPSFLRNDAGQLLIDPLTGLPISSGTATDGLVNIGDRTPDFKMGFINTFTFFKDISLSFNLDLRKGGDVFNGNEMMMVLQGLSTRTLDREQPRVVQGVLNDGLQNSATPTVNTIAINPYFKNAYYNGVIAEADYIESVDWLRLRDVTLGYQLPTKLLKRQKVVKSASVYVTATDVFLITNYTGIDPNVNVLNASNAKGYGGAGIDYGAIPNPRSINFGMKLNF
jgi:TonB-linked SusC/RagA family outer membrane protein